MESLRSPNSTKLKIGFPHPIMKSDKNVSMSSIFVGPLQLFSVQEFTEDEKKIIGELKQLYLETINLDVKMQREIYNMEKQYEQKHNEIFEKRKKILEYAETSIYATNKLISISYLQWFQETKSWWHHAQWECVHILAEGP